MASRNLLVYLLRHDLRVADNPILHRLAKSTDHGFTHLLPIYVFPAHQVEVSGFVRDGEKSPYPEARSGIAGYWRCGPHRAKFLGQSVWNLKENLGSLGSGLSVQAGMPADVLDHVLKHISSKGDKVGAVWMIGEEGVEERKDEKDMKNVCEKNGVECKIWVDEKYFIDDRDLDLASPKDLPDVFTTFRKSQEPLRTRPRKHVPRPDKGSLPPMPPSDALPDPMAPFESAQGYGDLERKLLQPLSSMLPKSSPPMPDGAKSAHPLDGGEDCARERLHHIIQSGVATKYKDTRNGLLGVDYSTKLSAYLALGCITAREVHSALIKFEDGEDPELENVEGYGKGENTGTGAIRFELLWRDYMRLCSRKFGQKMFRRSGFKDAGTYERKWKSANPEEAEKDQKPSPEEVGKILDRFREGTTGMGFIDAAMRELNHTGYTSNRTRQNVASFLARHLEIDWRYGAEWYEMMLIDYDVSSNWANWQYVAGTGNDPKETRIFNPVKQAFDYDPQGEYVRTWVPEVAKLEKLENVFQACTSPPEELKKLGIEDLPLVKDPLKRITFYVDRRPPRRQGGFHPRGQRGGGGGGGGGPPKGDAPRGAPRGPRSGGGYGPRGGGYGAKEYSGSHRGPNQRGGGGWNMSGSNSSGSGSSNGSAHSHSSGYGGGGGGYRGPSLGMGGYHGARGGPYQVDMRPHTSHYSTQAGDYTVTYYPMPGPPVSMPGMPHSHWMMANPPM